jgi:hypothetical protein
MTLDQLVQKLRTIHQEHYGDRETAHMQADRALIEFIDDRAVENAYDAIGKWYS